MRHGARLFVMAALLIGIGCAGDSTGGPVENGNGTLILQLRTPHADDGAMVFEVSGPAIDTVVALNASLRLFTRRANATTIVGAVVGTVSDGAIATLRVPDAGAATAYTARVIEVADRDNTLRDSLTGYSLTVIR